MGIERMITTNYKSLTPSNKKIADYILANISQVKGMTSKKLGEACGVGQSSIIKFIKLLGFDGFVDFKITLSEELSQSQTDSTFKALHGDIVSTDSLDLVIDKIRYRHLEAISGVAKTINKGHLKNIIKRLAKSQKVIILARGASGLVAKDLQNKLNKVGITTLFDFDEHVQLTHLLNANSSDTVIIISHSGENNLIQRGLKQLDLKKESVIGIFNTNTCKLAKFCEYIVATNLPPHKYRSSALTSRIAQLMVVDIIFIELIKVNENYLKHIDDSNKLIGVIKKRI